MELTLRIFRYLWYGFLGFLAVIALCIGWFYAIGVQQGVDDPETFFTAHRAELQGLVEKMRHTDVYAFRESTDYALARKRRRKPEDESLYLEVQSYLQAKKILAITVIGEDNGILDSVAFQLRYSISGYRGERVVKLYYVESGADTSAYLDPSQCKLLEAPYWLLCPFPQQSR